MTAPFVKRNRSRYADQLVCEAAGLEALRTATLGTAISIPAVLQVSERVLVLERIDAVVGFGDIRPDERPTCVSTFRATLRIISNGLTVARRELRKCSAARGPDTAVLAQFA